MLRDVQYIRIEPVSFMARSRRYTTAPTAGYVSQIAVELYQNLKKKKHEKQLTKFQ